MICSETYAEKSSSRMKANKTSYSCKISLKQKYKQNILWSLWGMSSLNTKWSTDWIWSVIDTTKNSVFTTRSTFLRTWRCPITCLSHKISWHMERTCTLSWTRSCLLRTKFWLQVVNWKQLIQYWDSCASCTTTISKKSYSTSLRLRLSSSFTDASNTSETWSNTSMVWTPWTSYAPFSPFINASWSKTTSQWASWDLGTVSWTVLLTWPMNWLNRPRPVLSFLRTSLSKISTSSWLRFRLLWRLSRRSSMWDSLSSYRQGLIFEGSTTKCCPTITWSITKNWSSLMPFERPSASLITLQAAQRIPKNRPIRSRKTLSQK